MFADAVSWDGHGEGGILVAGEAKTTVAAAGEEIFVVLAVGGTAIEVTEGRSLEAWEYDGC